ncbi:hypothetical protein ACIBF5_13250 [Micromonospora sp. NPDC050417]|uniref:hypothetical protein n=1 Tax=Micromonospora sp. NPDC050417 TaxID=3364280 RepID=UPI0037B77663
MRCQRISPEQKRLHPAGLLQFVPAPYTATQQAIREEPIDFLDGIDPADQLA